MQLITVLPLLATTCFISLSVGQSDRTAPGVANLVPPPPLGTFARQGNTQPHAAAPPLNGTQRNTQPLAAAPPLRNPAPQPLPDPIALPAVVVPPQMTRTAPNSLPLPLPTFIASLVPAPPLRGGDELPSGPLKGLVPNSNRCSRYNRPSPLQTAYEASDETKVCTLELEGIVYAPITNVRLYLEKISKEIRADIRLIMSNFATGNLDFIRSYMAKYNILITVLGPFGDPVLIGPTFAATTDPLMNSGTARTYLNEDGFYVDTTSGFYIYEFVIFSQNGQMVSFVLALATSELTNYPIDCTK